VTECIHGLELDRCDVCSPKPVPVPEPAPARSTRAVRQPSGSLSAPRRTASTAKLKPINISEQRIHHVTHLSNLAAILTSGLLRSDAAGAEPTLDMSSPSNRDVRRITPLAGGTVADYVPFYLTPNAALWDVVRAGGSDPRLSDLSRGLPASEFVVLVSTVGRAAQASGASQSQSPIVAADGDAADPRTRFTATIDDYQRVLRRLLGDQDSEDALRGEFLVRDSVPFDAIMLVGVANDRARDSVRDLLDSSKFVPRVAVHPPWFAATPED
jgi:hypothetical protein